MRTSVYMMHPAVYACTSVEQPPVISLEKRVMWNRYGERCPIVAAMDEDQEELDCMCVGCLLTYADTVIAEHPLRNGGVYHVELYCAPEDDDGTICLEMETFS